MEPPSLTVLDSPKGVAQAHHKWYTHCEDDTRNWSESLPIGSTQMSTASSVLLAVQLDTFAGTHPIDYGRFTSRKYGNTSKWKRREGGRPPSATEGG